MCGIVGVCGPEASATTVVEGLRRLEYRGYDSAGLAVFAHSGLVAKRFAEKTSSIELLEKWATDALANGELDAEPSAVIGHTRWATHGKPSRANAHPHFDCAGEIAVVHNGIVENYRELREELAHRGHVFTSETDTEVIVHLVEEHLRVEKDLLTAVRLTFAQLRGAMAFVVGTGSAPGHLVAVRRMAPLIVGLSETSCFVASDIPAILGRAQRFFQVPEGEAIDLASPSEPGYVFPSGLQEMSVEWDIDAAERGGYPHFMAKEIFEQPRAVEDTLSGRTSNGEIVLDGLKIDPSEFRGIDKVFMVACGTSFHASMVAKYAIEHFCRLPVELDISSEFRYRDPIVDSSTLVIGVSQSGETLDTMTAIEEARANGARTLVVSNVVDSSMARMADAVLYTHAGPEIGVAATKTHVAQIAALELFALYLAGVRHTMYPAEIEEMLVRLNEIPTLIGQALDRWDEYATLARSLSGYKRFYFLGRHVGFPVALEGALKLKEITYTPAEGYPGGELKHGPIAMIDEEAVVVGIASQTRLYEKLLANVEEVRARGAKVVLVTNEGAPGLNPADERFIVPLTHQLLAPLVDVIPLQALAYELSVMKGYDPDKPRNLAKTVTVE